MAAISIRKGMYLHEAVVKPNGSLVRRKDPFPEPVTTILCEVSDCHRNLRPMNAYRLV
jgi:hypothetical protein